MLDEGYIKYQSHWREAPATDSSQITELERWRQPLYEAGLIGHYKELGIGYGNISIRSDEPGQFLITGTQTGHLARTGPEHYALVTAYDIAGNSVTCQGPVQASSEAMTHAAIYELNSAIGAVVHVHSKTLWHRYLDSMPTTNRKIAYGTPQMADEFRRLYRCSDFPESGIAVMAGHEEGIVGIGSSLEQAATRILALVGD